MLNGERLEEFNRMNAIHQDEVLPPAIGRGAGESPVNYIENPLSFLDLRNPTEHGDDNYIYDRIPSNADIGQTYMGGDDWESEDSEDLAYDRFDAEEDCSYWLSDSNVDEAPQYGEDEPVEEQLPDTEDEDGYVPVSSFLSPQDFARDDWYDDPRGEDFRTAFSCLNNKKYLAKRYLLDMLSSANDDDEESTYQVDMDPNVQDEVTFALSDLLIPGLAKISVEKLCDLVVRYPSLELRGYLVDMDVFHIAYIIWGIDFYMHKKYGGYFEDDNFMGNDSEEEDKPIFADSIRKCWNKSLSWVLQSFSPANLVEKVAIHNS